MDIEELQAVAQKLPGVAQDVKWGHDLCFTIGGKMFLVVGLDVSPVTASFKASNEDFEGLTTREGFLPAPYLARHKWVYVDNIQRLKVEEWSDFVEKAYWLVREKLPKKILEGLP